MTFMTNDQKRAYAEPIQANEQLVAEFAEALAHPIQTQLMWIAERLRTGQPVVPAGDTTAVQNEDATG